MWLWTCSFVVLWWMTTNVCRMYDYFRSRNSLDMRAVKCRSREDFAPFRIPQLNKRTNFVYVSGTDEVYPPGIPPPTPHQGGTLIRKLMCEKGVFFAGVVSELNFSVPSVNASLKWLQFYQNNLFCLVSVLNLPEVLAVGFVVEVVSSCMSCLFMMK